MHPCIHSNLRSVGLPSGAPEEWTALSFATWLALASADTIRDSKAWWEVGPKGRRPWDFPPCPMCLRAILSLAPVFPFTQFPRQRSCSLPSPVLTSSRKPFRTDLQTPSVQSVNPTTHSCSCTLRISPVETISPIGVYFVSRAELSLQEAAWQMRSLRDSFGAKDLSLNPSLPRPCSVASEKRLNLSEPWCFYL